MQRLVDVCVFIVYARKSSSADEILVFLHGASAVLCYFETGSRSCAVRALCRAKSCCCRKGTSPARSLLIALWRIRFLCDQRREGGYRVANYSSHTPRAKQLTTRNTIAMLKHPFLAPFWPFTLPTLIELQLKQITST